MADSCFQNLSLFIGITVTKTPLEGVKVSVCSRWVTLPSNQLFTSSGLVIMRVILFGCDVVVVLFDFWCISSGGSLLAWYSPFNDYWLLRHPPKWLANKPNLLTWLQ